MSSCANVNAAGAEIVVSSTQARAMSDAMDVSDQLTSIVTCVFLIPAGIQTDDVYAMQDGLENTVIRTKENVMEHAWNVLAQQQVTALPV